MSRKPEAASAAPLHAGELSRSTTDSAGTCVLEAGTSWIGMLAAALLASCWLLPLEAAADGTTGGRAILWLLLAVGYAVLTVYRRNSSAPPVDRSEIGRPEQPRWGLWPLADLGVGLLIGGQLLSGLLILSGTGGQRRIAANLMVEWLGLAAAWWILRRLTRHQTWRTVLSLSVLVSAIVIAGLGLWQHFWELPTLAQELTPQLQAVRAGTAPAQMLAELAAQGVPLTEPGLTLFENRALSSREPFGMFALANSLGGLLALALVWMGTLCLQPRSAVKDSVSKASPPSLPTSALPRGLLWGGLCAVALTLLLTKSRTALAGAIVGSLTVLVLALVRRGPSGVTTKIWRGLAWALGGGVVVGVSGVGLILAGLWDVEVLAEAPKSLQYRLNYWQAAANLLAEQPWLGVGLGQFRAAYLRVRLPDASEEVTDPHNLLLDAWLNGGLLAVAGLVCLFVALIWAVKSWLVLATNPSPDRNPSPNFPSDASAWTRAARAVFQGGLLSHAVLFAASVVAAAWDDRLLLMGLAWGLIGWPMLALSPAVAVGWLQVGAWGAVVAGAVHLMGAGGFGMPAGLLLGLFTLQVACQSTSSPIAYIPNGSSTTVFRRRESDWVPLVLVSLGLVVASGLWWPGYLARQKLEMAQLSASRGQVVAARELLQAAARDDDWNPEPWRQLAELSARDWEQTVTASTAAARAEEIIALLHQARRRDPQNPRLEERMGEIRLGEFRLTGSDAAAQAAFTALRAAQQQFPTDVRILRKLSAAAEQAGKTDIAREVAHAALLRDQRNRELGHAELWLTAAEVEELRHRCGPDNEDHAGD